MGKQGDGNPPSKKQNQKGHPHGQHHAPPRREKTVGHRRSRRKPHRAEPLTNHKPEKEKHHPQNIVDGIINQIALRNQITIDAL